MGTNVKEDEPKAIQFYFAHFNTVISNFKIRRDDQSLHWNHINGKLQALTVTDSKL